MYFPAVQPLPTGSFFWPKHLVVRTIGDPMGLASAIRREILEVDPDQPVSNIRTMEQILDSEVSDRRVQTALLAAFAGLALLLSTVGMYGVLSYTVAQRTGEIGLRMALGARQPDILRMVVGRGVLMVGLGIAMGTAAAFGLTRALSSLLFGVTAADPATFAVVAILLLLIGLIASYIPARRAAALDPMIAIQHE
jgi:putative ABC transport system permease protein